MDGLNLITLTKYVAVLSGCDDHWKLVFDRSQEGKI